MALESPSYSSDCIKCADLSMLLDLNGFTLHLSPANRASSAWLDGCNSKDLTQDTPLLSGHSALGSLPRK